MTPAFLRVARFVGCLLAGLALFAPPTQADLADDGRKLIQRMADQVVDILADKRLNRAGREARFRRILVQNFDVPTIGAWVLGSPWAGATAAQRKDFLHLFEIYIVKVYTGQLATYSGEKVRVTGSEPDGEGVAVVSRVIDPNSERAIEVKWRLRKKGTQLKVRDVVIENISISQTQKREFAAVYQRRGGTVDGLIAALREKVAELDRPH
jgi:phospholipid transport system substrate-binding protein